MSYKGIEEERQPAIIAQQRCAKTESQHLLSIATCRMEGGESIILSPPAAICHCAPSDRSDTTITPVSEQRDRRASPPQQGARYFPRSQACSQPSGGASQDITLQGLQTRAVRDGSRTFNSTATCM